MSLDYYSLLDKTVCQRSKKGHILALKHVTQYPALVSILKTGLLTKKDIDDRRITVTTGMTTSDFGDYSDQFDGVYFTPLFDDLIGTPIDVFDEYWVILVFSPILLERSDYHLNLADQNGYLLDNSFGPNHLSEMYQARMDGSFAYFDNSDMNEVIFHNSIPSNFIEEIYIGAENQDQYDERLSIVTKLLEDSKIESSKIPPIHSFTLNWPKVTYSKFCDKSEILEELSQYKPTFCAAGPDNIKRYKLSNDLLNKIGANCGITDIKITPKSIETIRIKRVLDKSLITPTIYEPPFKVEYKNNSTSNIQIENFNSQI